LMLGLGFDEISATVPNVAALKQRVASLRQQDCEKLLREALACRTADEVTGLLEQEQVVSSHLPLLDAELVVMESDSRNKEEAIRELVDAVYLAGRTDDRQALEDAVWNREEKYSTALGFGFAIPHCKNDAVIADSIAVLRVKQPIAWGEEKVEFAILLAMRESAKDNTHMQVFSRLARKLMNEEFRAQLASAREVAAVIELLATTLKAERQVQQQC
jgi:multiphosphoryl transfer protein